MDMRQCSPTHVCQVSQVPIHISCVMCQVSCVTFNQSQAVRARNLKFWQNVLHALFFMCLVLRVTCHVKCVTMSQVVQNRKKKKYIYIYIYIGAASWWRVCYQRGTPCLFFNSTKTNFLITYVKCIYLFQSFNYFLLVSFICFFIHSEMNIWIYWWFFFYTFEWRSSSLGPFY